MEYLNHNILFGALFGSGLAGAYVKIVRGRYNLTASGGARSPFIEDMLRLPGHSERIRRSEHFDAIAVKYDQYVLWSVLLIATALLPDPILVIMAAIPCIAGCAYILRQSTKIHAKLQQSILKCDGEEYTGQELNHLWRYGASVYHDIPCDYGNIDHLVIGNDKIFVVETLTVSKVTKDAARQEEQSPTASYNGNTLVFPHQSTTDALDTARNNADFISQHISVVCGFNYPVKPVVAVPGWHVKILDSSNNDLLVINPKRGHGLKLWIGKKNKSKQHKIVHDYLSSVARSVPAKSRRTDSNASSEFEFWLSPRFKEKIIGD